MGVKGILLAGGKGTRLAPATAAVSKHLLPVFDKPLIYYSIANLMLCGLRDILIIARDQDIPHYQSLFGDGSALGIRVSYAVQEKPGGIPEALLIGEDFLQHDDLILALGDNIFHGSGLSVLFRGMGANSQGAKVLLKRVPDPARFGIANLSAAGKVISIEEKPTTPQSDAAITGLYFLDNSAIQRAKTLGASSRGELEIVDLLNSYLIEGSLEAIELPRGTLWLDTGTVESLLDAGVYVQSFEAHTNQLIGSPEEVAFRSGWITPEEFERLALAIKTSYGDRLLKVVDEKLRSAQ